MIASSRAKNLIKFFCVYVPQYKKYKFALFFGAHYNKDKLEMQVLVVFLNE